MRRTRCGVLLFVAVLSLAPARVVHAEHAGHTCLEMTVCLNQQEGTVLKAFPELQNDQVFQDYKAAKDKALEDITSGNTKGALVGVVKVWENGDNLYKTALHVRLRLLEILKAQGETAPYADSPAGELAQAALHVDLYCMTYF